MSFLHARAYLRLSSGGYLWWRGASRLPLVIVAAVSILSTSPTGADARPGYEVRPAGVKLVLSGGRRGGYLISVSANEWHRLQFRLGRPSATVEYSTEGHISNRRVQATFGAIGRVNVELDITRHRANPRLKEPCKGRGARYQEGTYRGEIKFPRQGNVPGISISQGRVYIKRRFRRVCKRQRLHFRLGGKAKLKRRIEAGILTVRGNSEGHTVLLEALDFAARQNPSRSGGRLAVEVYERREGVRIARGTNLLIDSTSFVMSKRGQTPETVEVEPPEPFAGSALYSSSSSSSPSWAGDLSVNLPGADSIIPLTGLGFSVALCRNSWMVEFKRCPLG